MGKIATFEEIRSHFGLPIPIPFDSNRCPAVSEVLAAWPNIRWTGPSDYTSDRLTELLMWRSTPPLLKNIINLRADKQGGGNINSGYLFGRLKLSNNSEVNFNIQEQAPAGMIIQGFQGSIEIAQSLTVVSVPQATFNYRSTSGGTLMTGFVGNITISGSNVNFKVGTIPI